MDSCVRILSVGTAKLAVADDKPTFWDRVEAGTWEPGTFRVLDELVRRGVAVIDIGAWVGPVSLYAAAHGARVLAVEADPEALRHLRANVAVNGGLASRIAVIARAASAGEEPVRLGASRKPGDSMSSVLLAESPTTWTAEPVTPAELVALAGRPSRLFVKLDIEGGEYALLPSLVEALEAGRDGAARALLVSLHPALLAAGGEPDVDGVTRASLAGLVGWEAFRVETGGPVPADLAAALAAGGVAGDWLLVHDWPEPVT